MLATAEDGDFKFSLIEGLTQRIDDYLEDSTGADLTDDENESLAFAITLRDQLGDILEEYEADEFIDRGDVVPGEEGVIRPIGPQGDDPDDPTGAARVSREYDLETTQQQRLRPGLASRRSQRTERGDGLQSEGSERPLLPRPERGAAYDPLKQGLEGVTEGLLDLFDPDRKKKKPLPERERPAIPMRRIIEPEPMPTDSIIWDPDDLPTFKPSPRPDWKPGPRPEPIEPHVFDPDTLRELAERRPPRTDADAWAEWTSQVRQTPFGTSFLNSMSGGGGGGNREKRISDIDKELHKNRARQDRLQE